MLDSSLQSIIDRSYILAYKEDVDPLFKALASESLRPEVIRPKYSPQELEYPSAIRTFITHHLSWQLAAKKSGYTLICEADFVPCIGIGKMPNFWPLEDPMAWGYLYQGSPRLLALVGERPYLRGHCAPLVAYIINGRIADLLCEFFRHEIATRGPSKYFAFDAHLQWFVMGRGGRAFMPSKHYGEHGGIANPEHRANFIARAGVHRADNLAGNLHFLPQYARANSLRFALTRAWARGLGFARLPTRWITDTSAYKNDPWEKLRMYRVGFKRLLA